MSDRRTLSSTDEEFMDCQAGDTPRKPGASTKIVPAASVCDEIPTSATEPAAVAPAAAISAADAPIAVSLARVPSAGGAAATDEPSVASAPPKAAKRPPRASAHHPPPDLPATASEVTDLASLSRVVTQLSSTIVKAVYEGRSVTAPNKRLIALAAEEAKRAMHAYERIYRETSSPSPSLSPTALTAPTAAPAAPSEFAALADSAAPAAPAAAPRPPAQAPGSLARELAACVREEFSKLKAELTQHARRAAARAPPGATYAQAASHKPPPPPPPVTRPAILVSTKAPVPSRQAAVEAFRRSISFRASDYAPARVQPVSRNKLRVEFDTEPQRADALRRLGDAGEVTAEPARMLRPMLILKGISRSTPPDELVEMVRRQNDCKTGELAFKFERKNRNPSLYSAVLVASPDVWRRLLDLGRVCVDHQRIHVERFSPFIQCYACLQFGHVRAACAAQAPKPCAFCASSAHQEPDCPAKGDRGSVRCCNCTSINAKFNGKGRTDHKATSGSCPVLRAMRARVEARVDYGLA